MALEWTPQERLASAAEVLGVVVELFGFDPTTLRLAQSMHEAAPSGEGFDEAMEQLTSRLEECGEMGKLIKGRCASLHPARETYLWPAVLEPLA